MPSLSPRDAVKIYQVSRATLMKALSDGTLSGSRDDAGHWRIDAAELARVYPPRSRKAAVNRPKPDQLSRNEPAQKTDLDHDIATRLALAEAALAAERQKTELLQRNLDALRRMLPPPDAKPRRGWPW